MAKRIGCHNILHTSALFYFVHNQNPSLFTGSHTNPPPPMHHHITDIHTTETTSKLSVNSQSICVYMVDSSFKNYKIVR